MFCLFFFFATKQSIIVLLSQILFCMFANHKLRLPRKNLASIIIIFLFTTFYLYKSIQCKIGSISICMYFESLRELLVLPNLQLSIKMCQIIILYFSIPIFNCYIFFKLIIWYGFKNKKGIILLFIWYSSLGTTKKKLLYLKNGCKKNVYNKIVVLIRVCQKIVCIYIIYCENVLLKV